MMCNSDSCKLHQSNHGVGHMLEVSKISDTCVNTFVKIYVNNYIFPIEFALEIGSCS